MAEAVGLVIGVVSLAGLFKNCLDAIETIQIGRRLHKDHGVLQQKLDNQKERFWNWGTRIGFTATQSAASAGERPKNVSPNVVKTMKQVVELFQSSEQLSARYNATQETSTSTELLQVTGGKTSLRSLMKRTRLSSTTPVPPVEKKSGVVRWVVGDRDKLLRLVDDLKDFIDDLEALTSASSLSLHKKLLSALAFPEMDSRQASIKQAESRTFNWIMDDGSGVDLQDKNHWDNFRSWLLHDGGSYLITGKPGSGKSTLMKYIWDHQITHEALATWSRGLPMSKPHFFFWNPGSDLQKSFLGVLRVLIYQILDDFPFLTSHVMSTLDQSQRSIIDKSDGSGVLWREEQLVALLHTLVECEDSSSLRFCFFLDGLDEFGGDRLAFLSLLRRIEGCQNTKLCLASRPLPMFTQHFGLSKRLRVHDLTQKDIEQYVSARISEALWDPSKAPTAIQVVRLIESITSRAEGVFLWVALVVKNLLEAIPNGDTIEELKNRLDKLPSELSTLYGHILTQSLDPFYRERLSLYLELMTSTQEPISLGLFFFAASSEVQDSYHLMVTKSAILTRTRIADILALRDTITARTGGLLEMRTFHGVPSSDSGKKDESINGAATDSEMSYVFENNYISFIHNSAYEFLTNPDTAPSWLNKPRTANALDRLIRATILSIIWLKEEPPLHSNWASPLLHAFNQFRKFARKYESLGLTNEESIDGLQTVLEYKRANQAWKEWRNYSMDFGDVESRPPSAVRDFVGLMASSGLFRYVEKKVSALDPDTRPATAGYLLQCCLEAIAVNQIAPTSKEVLVNAHHLNLELLNTLDLPEKLLRDYDADPNIVCACINFDGTEVFYATTWARFFTGWCYLIIQAEHSKYLKPAVLRQLGLPLLAYGCNLTCAFLDADADLSILPELWEYSVYVPWHSGTRLVSMIDHCHIYGKRSPIEWIRRIQGKAHYGQEHIQKVVASMLTRSQELQIGSSQLQVKRGPIDLQTLELSGEEHTALSTMLDARFTATWSHTEEQREYLNLDVRNCVAYILQLHFPENIRIHDWHSLHWRLQHGFEPLHFVHFHRLVPDDRLRDFGWDFPAIIDSRVLEHRMLEWWYSLTIEQRDAARVAANAALEISRNNRWKVW